jgi:hypothetical protein
MISNFFKSQELDLLKSQHRKPGVLTKADLKELLIPILRRLKSPGVAAFIEPSVFFQDTKTDRDWDFHQGRFSNEQFYKEIHLEIRKEHLPELLRTDRCEPPPHVRFDFSAETSLK